MADIAKFVEEIKGLTVMELADLVKAIEEEFGVSAAAAAVAAPAAGQPAAPPVPPESRVLPSVSPFRPNYRTLLTVYFSKNSC